MVLAGITEFTIYEADKLQNIFLEFLKEEKDFVLNMESIQKIDMVGIQLLLSLVKSADASNKKISFSNIPQNILEEIKTSNCDKALGITNG